MSKLNEQGLEILVEEINRNINTKINETVGSIDTSVLATKSEVSQVDSKVNQNKIDISSNTTDIGKVKESVDTKFDKTGGTFEGVVKAQSNTNYSTAQLRNVILSPSDPDPNVGENGDIWIKYIEVE